MFVFSQSGKISWLVRINIIQCQYIRKQKKTFVLFVINNKSNKLVTCGDWPPRRRLHALHYRTVLVLFWFASHLYQYEHKKNTRIVTNTVWVVNGIWVFGFVSCVHNTRCMAKAIVVSRGDAFILRIITANKRDTKSNSFWGGRGGLELGEKC